MSTSEHELSAGEALLREIEQLWAESDVARQQRPGRVLARPRRTIIDVDVKPTASALPTS